MTVKQKVVFGALKDFSSSVLTFFRGFALKGVIGRLKRNLNAFFFLFLSLRYAKMVSFVKKRSS